MLMTDEVLTERGAGWHSGKWKPWRLRGRPEIALPLLHAALHHNWLHRHGCHGITKPTRYHGKGTAAPVTHASSHKRGKNSDTVYYCTWCDVFPSKQQPLDADSYKHCTSYIITFCAPHRIHVIFCLLLWKQGRMYLLTFHAAKHTLEAVFSHKYRMIWHARRGGEKTQCSFLTT